MVLDKGLQEVKYLIIWTMNKQKWQIKLDVIELILSLLNMIQETYAVQSQFYVTFV